MANSFEIPTIYVHRLNNKPCGSFGDYPLLDTNDMNKPYPLGGIHGHHTIKDLVFGPYIDFSAIFGKTEADDLPTRSIDDILLVQDANEIIIYDRHYHLGSEHKTLNEINWLDITDYRRNLIIFKPVLKLPAKFKEFKGLSWSPTTKNSVPITPTQTQFEIDVINLIEDNGFGHMPVSRFLVPTSPEYKQFDSSFLFKRRDSGYSWALLDSINNTFKQIHYQVGTYTHESKTLNKSELARYIEYAKNQREEFFKRHYSHCHSKR